MARKMPAEEFVDDGKKVEQTDAEFLSEYRKKQMTLGPGEEMTFEERAKFVELQEKEASAKSGKESVSDLEKNRFRELSIKQMNDDLSVGESEELKFLYERTSGQK